MIKSVLSTDLNVRIDEILKENLAQYGEKITRMKRAEKSGTFYREKSKIDLPICQNMKGILGNIFLINEIKITLVNLKFDLQFLLL